MTEFIPATLDLIRVQPISQHTNTELGDRVIFPEVEYWTTQTVLRGVWPTGQRNHVTLLRVACSGVEYEVVSQTGQSFDQITGAWYYQYVISPIPEDSTSLDLHFRTYTDTEFTDVVITLRLA